MAAPKHANIQVGIGNQSGDAYIISPENFSRISVERVVSDAADKFTLNVLDDDAFTLEKALIAGNNAIHFSYFDDKNKVKEQFSGSITKMNSSFVNNRNMLTLEGYVGLNIQDKYELKSRNWNRAVLFPWKEVFDNPTSEDALKLLKDNEIYQDDAGQFYTYSHKEKDNKDGKDKKVVAGEEVIIPVRPSDIVNLMIKGGTLDSLMLDDIEKYKKCDTFYNLIKETRKEYNEESTKIVMNAGGMLEQQTFPSKNIDMPFLKAFLKKHDKVESNGWSKGIISKTKLVEKDLSQTCKSDVGYIYNVLCNVSIENTEKDNDTRYNYMFNITNGKVYFEPIVVEANRSDKTLVYYGDFQSEDDDVKLLSFSADTNILTAFLTGDDSSVDKMSTLNLVTGEDMSDASEEVDKSEYFEAQYKYSFKTTTFTTFKNNLTRNGARSNFLDTWRQAMASNYKAEATVVGYTGLAPGKYVDIIVAPNKANGKIWYHHTSGLYYIIKMTNTIEAGKMTSNLELIKNVASLGQSILKNKSKENNVKSSGGGSR